MVKEVEITRESFKGEDKQEHAYNSIKLTIMDKTFSLYPKSEQKSLLNYLIDVELEANGEA
ncbi:MAG: hypothetical protein K2G31_04450 [Clostridia bacterium]|nr:hypothetical protein [Clostridia bacterium]